MILDSRASTDPNYVELESGLVIPEWLAEERAQEKRRPLAVDLFCGCGGMSLGMMQGGFEVVAACDFEAFAAMTYMHNLGAYPCQFHFIEPGDAARLEKALAPKGSKSKHEGIEEAFVSGGGWRSSEPDVPGVSHFFFGDVAKLSGAEILKAIGLERGELDCVCGSPPCQGFSRAGKQNVLDPRNSLVFEFVRLVLELRPKTMVFENVPGIVDMVTPAGVPVIDEICRVLEDGGFGTADALKRTLAAQAGSVGLLRGNSRKSEKPVKAKAKRSAQRQLFR